MLIGGSILLALQNGGFRQGREAESLGMAEGTEEESYQDGFAEGHELPGEIDIIVAIDCWPLGKTKANLFNHRGHRGESSDPRRARGVMQSQCLGLRPQERIGAADSSPLLAR